MPAVARIGRRRRTGRCQYPPGTVTSSDARRTQIAMDKKPEKIVRVALIATGLITYGVATYLIVKIVVALNALNTVPPQPKKLPEARAVGSGHVENRRAAKIFPMPAARSGRIAS